MQEVLPGFRAAFGSLLPRTESTPLFGFQFRRPLGRPGPWYRPGHTRGLGAPVTGAHPGLGSSRSSPPSQLEFSVVLRPASAGEGRQWESNEAQLADVPSVFGGIWGPS